MVNIHDDLINTLNECEIYMLLKIAVRMRTYRMTAWPSIARLAKDCGWEEKKAKRVRSGLLDKDVLGVKEVPGKSSIYYFKCEISLYYGLKGKEVEEENEAKTPPPKKGGGRY